MSILRWTTIAAALWAWAPRAVAQGADAAQQAPGYRYALEIDRDTRFRMADALRDEAIQQLEDDILPKFGKADPERPDLMFQLSEYYWEKFRYLYALEEKKNDEALRAWDAARSRKEKVGPPPKADHSHSEQYRAKTLQLYGEILLDHRQFQKTDHVLFALASNLQDLGYIKQEPKLRAEAAKRYEELIRRFPKSPLAGDTYIQLGDFYFDNNRLEPAAKAYERALSSKVPKVSSYALYKLAWCDYNRGDFQKGLKRLHEVVDFAEQQGRRMIDLKNEALNDAVIFYTRLDKPADAIAYFDEKAPPERRGKLIGKLARELSDAGFLDHSTTVFRWLIERDPLRPDAPELQQGVVSNFERLRQQKAVKQEIRILAETYRPGGAWWQANAKDRSVLRNGFEVAEQATRQLVTEYNQEAQKTQQVETFRLVRDLYRQYLDAFASSPDEEFVSDHAFNMRFYCAQVLWGLEEWEASAEQYDQVVRAKIPARDTAREISNEEYRKLAAYSAILAYDKLIKIERGELDRSRLSGSERIRDDKQKGGMTQVGKIAWRIVKGAPAQPLTRTEQKMVDACDAYARLAPRLKEPKDEVDIQFQAAVVFYERSQFDEAAKRFQELVRLWPEEKRSVQAADLTMYILEGLERWEELKAVSAAFLADPRLAKPGTDLARRVSRVLEGAGYKWIDEVVYKQRKQPERAAEEFLAYAKAHPKAEAADRALVYAMVIFRDLHQYDRAISAGRQLLAGYKGSLLEPKVVYTLAALQEKVADFEGAARSYEEFLAVQDRQAKAVDALAQQVQDARRKKVEPEQLAGLEGQLATARQLLDEARGFRPDAWYNAGVWWEGLGQTDKAVAAFRGYLREFRDRKDVPQVMMRVASIQERSKRFADAAKTYDEVARDKRTTPAQSYLATYRELAASTRVDRPRDVGKLATELVSRWSRLSAADEENLPQLYAYAHARLLGLEPTWSAYARIKLDRVRHLQGDLKAKQRLLAELEKGYFAILQLGAGEHSIGAVIRLGLAYEDMARAILASPMPPGLDADQQQLYREGLENAARPLEEKALDAFEKALDKSYELGLYGEWVVMAQEKVNSYKPGTYAAAREVPSEGSGLFATSSALEPAQGTGGLRAAFARGASAFDQGDLDEAEEAFEEVLDAQPDCAPALYDLGLVAERRGDQARARKRYEAALAKDPRHVRALLNLSRLQRTAGELDQAVALLERAAAGPALQNDVAILNDLVVAYRLAKKFDLAEATARRALARSANSADAYNNLALVYYDQGRYQLAELLGAEALKLDDRDPGIYNNLGLTALKLGDRARALALFKKAVELDPSFAPGHRNIGALALAYRDYATAQRELGKARELAPGSPDAELAYSYALDGQKGRDPSKGLEAGKAFERVLALQANRVDAICAAGWAYSADRAGWDKAIDYLRKCKEVPGTAEKDARAIDSKIQNLLALKEEAGSQAGALSPNDTPAGNTGAEDRPSNNGQPVP